jgi:hypothetical protein
MQLVQGAYIYVNRAETHVSLCKQSVNLCVCLDMQECLIVPRDDVKATMKKAGVVDALKATLKHESPYSVAAAVGALHTLGQTPRGQALVEAGGAMTALVRIIEKLPSDYENDRKVSPRCASQHTCLARRTWPDRCSPCTPLLGLI